MRSLGFVLFVVLMSPFASAQSHAHESQPQKSVEKAAPTEAQKTFDKLKTLAGSWEGHLRVAPAVPEVEGKAAQVIFRVASRGHTLMHDLKIEGMPDNPITMLVVDADRLLLTHYCDADNRPRMIGKSVAGREDRGVRFSRYLGQRGARTHASCGVHLRRREPSHRGLDLHDAGRQADARALRAAADTEAGARVSGRVTRDLEALMDREWNDSQPIYRQLRDRVVAMILDGVLKEGDPLPSVRTVAAEYRVNPLTVLKGYQQLVDEGLVETRRGLGMFVNAGARSLLLQGERQKFLGEEWPRIQATIQRLGLKAEELLTAQPAGRLRIRHVRNPPSRSPPKGSAEAMACIEAHGLRKAFGTTIALDGIESAVEEGRILGLIGPNGAGKTTALNAILGLTPYEGELTVLGRDPWSERDQLMRDVCFICRRRRAAALDAGFAGARLRRRRASAVRSLPRRRLSRQDHASRRDQQGQGVVEGHGDATAPRAGHGDRREIAGAGRADARPRHPVSQAVLRFAAERLLRSQPHHRRDDAPGGRGPARPHRCRCSSTAAASSSIAAWRNWSRAIWK